MPSVIYVIDQSHHDHLVSKLEKVYVGPKYYWAAPVESDTEGLYDFLLPLVEMVKLDHEIDAPTIAVPEGKIVIGVGCSWLEDEKVKGKDCDLFALHPLMDTAWQAVIWQMYRVADYVLGKPRPQKKVALGWQYEQTSDGYYALRLRGLWQ
ncbi:hypothetical protein [Pseudomonas phage D6]|nr:hypothetical protein [Pseudomonas phage D6]